MRMQLKL